MTELARLQQAFLQALSQQEDCLVDSVLSTPDLSAQKRIGIYRNAYFARLKQVLAEDYPALAAMLGDAAFDRLCQSYILQNPSEQTSIRWFGDKLPDFITRTSPYQQHGILYELAEWERLLRKIFDSENAEVLTLAHLQQLPLEQWPELRLKLIPASTTMTQRFNTVPVWRALKNEQIPPAVVVQAPEVHWLLWRVDWVTQFRSMEVDEYAVLQAVISGATFADLCELLWDTHEDQAPARAAALLQGWVMAQLVSVDTLQCFG